MKSKIKIHTVEKIKQNLETSIRDNTKKQGSETVTPNGFMVS
jgi:hypothetical protein